MITSYIQGGLGNQLFQIAAGLSLAHDIGVDFKLVKGQHNLPQQGTRIENYYLNIFKNIKFFEESPKTLIPYHEKSFEYCEIPKIDNLAIIGYFQSEKYFSKNIDLIKTTFDFPYRDTLEGVVSLHIRQGDYNKNLNFHDIQKLDYFYKAIKNIGPYKKLFVFSDSELPSEFQFNNMEVIKSGNDLEDMSIMASCEHNIISNSTFSWWAAWLNNNKNKKIIAPSIWFGPSGPSNWSDIYCNDWVII
jgi:hypothetical protein